MRRLLTDLTLRKIVPERGTRIDVWDTRLPGFGVRISKTGVKTFVLMYRASGTKRRTTLGRWPVLSLGQAREMAISTLNKVTLGFDPQMETRAQRTDQEEHRFPEVARAFIELHCKRHNRVVTRRDTERILKNRFLNAWSRRDIRDISKTDVLKILDGVVAEGTPSAANHALSAVRKLFNWCVERGLIEHSPCAGIRKPARDKSRQRVLSDDEILAIWQAADLVGHAFGPIVQLLILTGQRRSEVAAMRWTCVDLSQQLWVLPAELTKSNREHSLPLSALVVDILRNVPRLDVEYVFPSRGSTPGCFANFSQAKSRLDMLSGVTGWTLHDLRRTTATGMARLQVSPHVIERVLNHTTGTLGGIAGIYNRFQYIPEMRAALELWAEHVGTLVSPAEQGRR